MHFCLRKSEKRERERREWVHLFLNKVRLASSTEGHPKVGTAMAF